jgi:hypothetical protein
MKIDLKFSVHYLFLILSINKVIRHFKEVLKL